MNPSEDFLSAAAAAEPSGRSIGAILIDAGRLRAQDAEAVLRLQQERGLRFGDAALALGLVSAADLRFALSRQFSYPYLQRADSKLSAELVAAFDPQHAQVEALRALRAQLIVRVFEGSPTRKSLAIASAGRGDGRSWMAANLAVVFAQLGARTLLVDADLRQPRQHQLFGLDNRVGLSALLAGRAGAEAIQDVPGLDQLAVLCAGASPPNPQELLTRPAFGHLLGTFAERYDVILLDSSAGIASADGQTVALRAGAALLLARRDVSRRAQFRAHANALAQAGVCLAGTVLAEH